MAAQFDEDLFEQTGPYEPITTRIRNILREYKDGVGIFKELIQNADDAGATTVKFLIDWRQGQSNSLFSPGLAECQGPALWAYNDAVFTDEDFENINKLAGETKVEDLSKIGRFGLGFNAVYHLTDVPSFISREYLVIFDPNANHLQHHIKDRSRPGIRTNLSKKPESFTRYQDQFQPYNGVFGCNMSQNHGGFKYKGTLFRFPFRTANQARTSDISKYAYGQVRIQAIVRSLCECATTLLIFSQHVKKIEVYELDASHQPIQMRLLISVNQPSAQAFGLRGVSNSEPFIKQCSKWWEKYRDSKNSCLEYPSGCELVNITTIMEPSELSGCKHKHSSNEMWFVVSASGTSTSLTIARSLEGKSHGLLPCGGAAFVIQTDSGQGSWESYVASNPSGELFCFLPLSIRTGLPVHVNGYFAIMSNRVEIWKRTSMRSQPIEVTWNEALMEDPLARAYIMLLENMKAISSKIQHYEFHTLWPACEDIDMKSWEKLVQKICSVLLESKSKLFYSDGLWMSVGEGFLLSDDFDEIYDAAEEVLRSLGKHLFKLPRKILTTLAKFDQRGILKHRTLSFIMFLQQHFFPNIKYFPPTQRDSIVCFGLDRILKRNQPYLSTYTPEIDLFHKYPCISVSKNEETLKKPCELIHPSGQAAQLFSDQDNRFPRGEGLRDGNRLYVLETLGMTRDLDWVGIQERAQSIAALGYSAKTERSRELVKYLNKRIDLLPNPAFYSQLLQDVKFIPVLTKPVEGYLLPWKGSQHASTTFCAPKDVFLPQKANLIGSSCYIVNTSVQTGCGKLNTVVQELLGFSSRQPEDRFVIQQLDEAIKFWCNLSEDDKKDASKRFAIESICQKIYEFFNDRIAEERRNHDFLNELGRRNWLFFEGEFVESKKVAYTSNGNGAPFLFTLPSNYIRDYRYLLEAMDIKQAFDEEDYISALHELQNLKQGSVLTEDELQIAISFISKINVENPIVEGHIGDIPLPATDRILHQSEELVVNLNLWLQDPDDNLKVHGKIPPETARYLGAKLLKNVILSECSQSIEYGESFGQHEDLTDRLKGILDSYPSEGILKELVQNADDAEASEIHFIHDTRSLATEKVVIKDETSEEIQGPALCVYNDKPFTDRDLEGLKHLGIGSKRDSPGMTGRYGIGFNSVYHLTDCPSFLSNDDKLVFLDPHCRYLPQAESGNPGEIFKLNKIRNKFPDTIDGYLGDHFNLQGSTMFRFPLRQKESESKISNVSVEIEELFTTFQKEARNSLLFLNHIKKITFSRISNDKPEEIYQVKTIIAEDDEKKRQQMARKICNLNCTPTAEIEWEGVNYTLTIKENRKEVEKWLIQQCIGSISSTITNSSSDVEENEIPDGRELGLLPRGGLAARLWTNLSPPEKKLRGIVCCFLPLPTDDTKLPVHVNGDFALDNHRRDLFTDPDGKELKFKWNHFMKSRVLPPAYAALITGAQKHLCNDSADNRQSRYHALFPKVSNDSPWKTLTIGLYDYLGQTRAKVLPFLVPVKEDEGTVDAQKEFPANEMYDREDTVTTFIRQEFSGKNTDNEKETATTSTGKANSKKNVNDNELAVHFTEWLSADQAYFVKSDTANKDFNNFWLFLIQIGLPVLFYAPFRIYRGFQSAGVTSYQVTPKSVVGFLRDFKCPGSPCKIGQLPKKLETTAIKNVSELKLLIDYCNKDDEFGKKLQELPLLLTHDGYLRVFDSGRPVFGSQFGDLFPTKTSFFVYAEIVSLIKRIASKSEEKIVCDFTVNDLADLLPHVFTDRTLRDIEDHEMWNFPSEGILSVKWFKKFWDYLQNDAKPRTSQGFVALECMSESPVIPTTCGKLVKINSAKTVLDMTTSGTELTEQKNIRIFLSNLKCPMLNKEITFTDKHSSSSNDSESVDEDQVTSKLEALERKTAVTDHYVAHPHNVIDVLGVLNHMLNAQMLDLSKTDEEEVLNFLKFVQDNYRGSELLDDHKQIIKRLPFHKALNGQLVSLTDQYSSYALVPSGVPKEQLEELQQRARCLFLDSKSLNTLEKLYSDLDVRGSDNVLQFYTEYVFQHFSMFTPETQRQHVLYIGNEVYPELPLGFQPEKKKFLSRMRSIPCIPDENGNLHPANKFFHPQNKIFQLVFEGKDGKFPPSPFNGEDWLNFLTDIGLQVDVTDQLFLEFCRQVAEDGRASPSNQRIHKRSKELVKFLFSEITLRGDKFLFELSNIKFIAPAKVDKGLTSIHKQYQCSDNGYPPFIKFCKAVPWYFRELAWTTASILPIWAQPYWMAPFRNLGIACNGPAYPVVVNHLRNVISVCTHESVDISRLHEITKFIYTHLWKLTCCSGREPSDECSDVCEHIGTLLKNDKNDKNDCPCIFLPEDKVFVGAERLVFKLRDDGHLKPFLYQVPLVFGELEHLFKRLGATDKPTPSQIVNYVLNEMHKEIGEEKLSSEDEKKVKYAMYYLFGSLYRGETADTVEELYLLSHSKRLVKSCDLVCKVSPRFNEIVERFQRPILLSLKECSLKKVSDDYINALPEHLRPMKFEDLVREDIDPECKVSICSEARHGGKCNFQVRFETLLRSDEFQQGLKRLLVQGGQNPQKFEQTIQELQINTGVQIKCVGLNNVKISVIDRDTDEVLAHLEDSSYAVRNEETWSLYLQHEFKDDRSLDSIASCVNKILKECIHKELMLSAMLGCLSPNEIEKKLNKYGVTQSTTKSDDEGPEWDSDDESGDKKGDCDDGTGHFSTGDEDDTFYPMSRDEAMRWVKQSKSDLDGARWLLHDESSPRTSSNPPFNALACFQSHQVAEKCLKAMLFAKCGMSGGTLISHKVDQLGDIVNDQMEIPYELIQSVRKVSHYYLNTRYPNRQPFDRVPAEVYSKNEAEKAVEAASRVLEIVEDYLND